MSRGAQWRRVRRHVLERDGYACCRCGRRGVRLEVDHVVPLKDGGTDDLSNLQTLCKPCHAAKTRAENTVHHVAGQDEWAAHVTATRWERERPDAGVS
ncbi:MAG: HNH endonuclease [Gammaproteobacteria bacterium]|nr:HNH endonuclease [Gammaproteobacteria bacterium]